MDYGARNAGVGSTAVVVVVGPGGGKELFLGCGLPVDNGKISGRSVGAIWLGAGDCRCHDRLRKSQWSGMSDNV